MADTALRALAFLCALSGMSWVALAMESHWGQVREASTYKVAVAGRLRFVGAAALLASFAVGLRVDHASMASLVWIMSSSASALIVAITLAYRPRWLAWWVGGPRV